MITLQASSKLCNISHLATTLMSQRKRNDCRKIYVILLKLSLTQIRESVTLFKISNSILGLLLDYKQIQINRTRQLTRTSTLISIKRTRMIDKDCRNFRALHIKTVCTKAPTISVSSNKRMNCSIWLIKDMSSNHLIYICNHQEAKAKKRPNSKTSCLRRILRSRNNHVRVST